MKHKYNDVKFRINKKFKKNLKKKLIQSKSPFAKDKRLLNHFGFLFTRENYVQNPNSIKSNYKDDTINYEYIQGQNWNNVRLKVPLNYDEKLGWLVEFRPMDTPILNSEKTAFVLFTKLMHRLFVDQQLGVNFYIPMSKANENFNLAKTRNAFQQNKFTFRKYFSQELHGRNC